MALRRDPPSSEGIARQLKPPAPRSMAIHQTAILVLLAAAACLNLDSFPANGGKWTAAPLHSNTSVQTAGTSERSSGVCFDDQPRDGWSMARVICEDDLPSQFQPSASIGTGEKRPPPSSVAICVMGKTRSFTSLLAQESLRTNLASSFGATHTSICFHLFPKDKRGDSKKQYSGELHSSAHQSLNAALNVLRMEEGDFAKANGQGEDEGSEYHHWVSEACGAEIVVDDREDGDVYKSNMQNYTASRPIGEFNAMMATRDEAFHRGFVAQWTAVKHCYDFVQREEARMGHKFDFVIRTRPDMAYSRALKPHCLYSPRDIWMQHDWMFVLPRRVLDYLQQIYAEGIMNDSNPDFASKGTENPEQYLFRMLSSEKSKADFDHNGCCERGATRVDGMVAGAMLLRPQGPTFPINICHNKMANEVGGSQFCVDRLQHNRYNMPFDHLPKQKVHNNPAGRMLRTEAKQNE